MRQRSPTLGRSLTRTKLKRFRRLKSHNKDEPEIKVSDASTTGSGFDVARGRSDELLATSASDSIHGRSPSPTPPVLGLHVVYEPEHHSTDIVFVHGLGGHSHRTWTKNHDPARFWPGQWLPFEPDVATARILTFGYNANWKGSTKSVSTITDFAKELLYEMRFARDSTGTDLDMGARPIIFVVHSMGGLVVKKAYLLGMHDETYRDVVQSVSAMIFLSTPHRGTNLAETLNRVVAATMQASKSFISDLNKSSVALEELNEQFRHLAPSLSIWSFYETMATTIGPRKLMILEKDSSILGYPAEISRPLQADHQSMCKYDSPNDSNYVSVRNAIKSLVALLRDRAAQSAQSFEPENRTAIDAFFRSCSTSEDDYNSLRRQWIPETCGWFLEDPQVASCIENSSTSQILWYSAPPATGKSVLSAFLVNHLRESNRRCQFFLFKHSDSTRRSVVNALRALATQLARDVPDFKKRLYASSLESLGLESADALVIWQNTFERILFDIHISQPIYWVLDALDECDSPKTLLACLQSLAKAKLPIKVIILSRSTDSLSVAFDRASRHVPVGRIEKVGQAHNQHDIEVFVDREMGHMPGSEQFRQQLQKKVLGRSEGNFLWTKLVMIEIMECHTEESIDEVLDEIPDDMTELYQRMERNLLSSTKRGNKPLVRALLEWTMCAQRALTLKELSQALQPEFTGFIDLKRTITNACGQFIQVDVKDRVGILHHTTREYFTRSQGSELHINTRQTQGKLFGKTVSVLQDLSLRSRLLQYQHSLQPREPFVFYSAVGWPYHLGHCISNSTDHMDRLVQFFRSAAVLSWIHTLCLLQRLEVLIKASKVLTSVVKNIRKRDASRNPMLHRLTDLELLDNWTVDLLRIVGKFGRQLVADPSIIYGIIPALCPSETAIHQQCYNPNSSNIRLYGTEDAGWNDHLGRLTMQHEAQVWNICCAAKTVAVLASTNIVHIWDSTTFAEGGHITHGEAVAAMALTDSAGKLVTYGLKTTKLWSLPSGTLLASAPSPPNSKAIAMAFSANNDRVLAGSDDNAIRYISCDDFQQGWRILSRTLLKATSRVDGLLNSPMWLEFSPDGDHVAASYRGAPLSVWRLSNGRCVNKCHRATDARTHRRPSTNWFAVDRCTWNPITGHVIGIYRDGYVFKWHPIANEMTESQRTADEVSASPSGKVFATSSSDGSIRIWNFAYFTVIYQLSSEDLVTGLMFSPDSRRFYDLRGGSVNAWEPNCLARSLESEEHMSDTNSEDHSVTAASKYSEARVHQFEAVTAVRVSPDGQSYCAGYEDGGVLLFRGQATEGVEIARFYNFLNVSHISWSADGSCIACADLAGEVQVLSIQHGSEPAPHPSPQIDIKGHITDLILSPDATMLFILTDKDAFFCSVETGRMQGSMDLQLESPRTWLCHPKFPGLLLAFGSADVHVYDWATLEKTTRASYYELELSAGAGIRNMANLTMSAAGPPGDEETSDRDLSSGPVIKVLQSASHILLLMQYAKTPDQNVDRSQAMIFRVDDLTAANDTPPAIRSTLGYTRMPTHVFSKIHTALGVLLDSELAFLDDNMWLHTYSLPAQQGLPSDAVRRHYFVPRDWVGGASLGNCSISEEGTLFWPKDNRVVRVECSFDSGRAFA